MYLISVASRASNVFEQHEVPADHAVVSNKEGTWSKFGHDLVRDYSSMKMTKIWIEGSHLHTTFIIAISINFDSC